MDKPKKLSNKELLQLLKDSKQLFIDNPSYMGMCHCIGLVYDGKTYGSTEHSQDEFIKELIPEFTREFLQAPKERNSYAFWWKTMDEKGKQARLDAFDKLIKVYEGR